MILNREPVVLQVLLLAAVNLLVAFDVVSLDGTQLAALNAIVAAVLGAITRQLVSPVTAAIPATVREGHR